MTQAEAQTTQRKARQRLEGYGSPLHLAARFFESVLPHGPGHDEQAWALGHLSEQEGRLFCAMSGADRRHAVAVAHRALEGAASSPGVPDGFVSAALLHDVGKLEAGLGVMGRVAATLLALARGRKSVAGWAEGTGMRARVGRYVTHDQIGAAALERAGSNAFVVAWAREHHMPEERWSVAAPFGRILKEADGD